MGEKQSSYERRLSWGIIYFFKLGCTDSGIFAGIFEGSGKG